MHESDLSPVISPVTQDFLNEDNPISYGRQLDIVVNTLEKLAKKKIDQRRDTHGKKENTCFDCF